MKTAVLLLAGLALVSTASAHPHAYRGCYSDTGTNGRFFSGTLSTNMDDPTPNTMTLEVCADHCIALGYPFFGLKASKYCLCGDGFGTTAAVAESNCNNPCTGDSSQICGDGNYLSAYDVNTYKGCFHDSATGPDRFFLGTGNTITSLNPDTDLQSCAAHCAGFKYFGVKYGYWCFCSDNYGVKTALAESNCAMACVGDSSQTCGGASNAMSVYATPESVLQYTQVTDIDYYPSGATLTPLQTTRCKLDVYYPNNHPSTFTTVIWFHGGSLKHNDKTTPSELKKQGIAVVAVQYRLSTVDETSPTEVVSHPDYLDDAAAAVAWVYNNIATYGGSNTKVIVAGYSAGGWLAAMTVLDKHRLNDVYSIDSHFPIGLASYSGHWIAHATVREEEGYTGYYDVMAMPEYAPLYYANVTLPFKVFMATASR